MMSQIYSNSRVSRLCLISFILFCCVFRTENAFSDPWHRDFFKAAYDPKDETINFTIHYYNIKGVNSTELGFGEELNLEYSEDGDTFIPLLKVQTDNRYKKKDMIWSSINFMKPDSNIEFPGCSVEENKGFKLVGLNLTGMRSRKSADLNIKWHWPKSIKSIKAFKLGGMWTNTVSGSSYSTFIVETYRRYINRKKQSTLKDAHTVLKSEISNDVKVTHKNDAIIVTGAMPGDIIKVYANSGAEVKSVVAKDDVIGILLPKNQSYFVKVGQARRKVSL